MQRRISNFLIVLLVACLLGCVTSGRKIDQAAADQIEKGKTTKEQVVALIGSPESITRSSNGDTTYTYRYVRATAKPINFIPVVGAFAGGANMQQQMYRVTFNPKGIVKDYSSTYGASEADTGLAAGGKPEIPEVEENKRAK
jgi:outer membrane protein assembly factor BamE (lipoprotein component of BamABCDE complex)